MVTSKSSMALVQAHEGVEASIVALGQYSSTRPFGARAKSDLWTEYGLFVSLDGGDFNWAIVAFMNAGNVKMCYWPERMVCEARAKRAGSRP